MHDVIAIGDNIKIHVLSLAKKSIAIGIAAPKELAICREEAKKKEPRR